MTHNIKDIFTGTLEKIDFSSFTSHPNILIAASFWEKERYEAAIVCYRFMRMIDDLIDDRKADDKAISCIEKEILTEKVTKWIGCLDQQSETDPFLRKVRETIDRFSIPLEFFQRFAKSMIYDINHTGFESFEDFLEYSEGASNGPASVFLHLCCLQHAGKGYVASGLDISDLSRPCATFSYIVHIIRDFQKDQKNNLNYFALDILRKNNLTPADLRESAESGIITPGLREVIREYHQRAGEYKSATEKAIDQLSLYLEPRYLLSLRVIYELYLQIFERIDVKKGCFSTEELNPSPSELKNRLLKLSCLPDLQLT